MSKNFTEKKRTTTFIFFCNKASLSRKGYPCQFFAFPFLESQRPVTNIIIASKREGDEKDTQEGRII